MSSIPQKKFHLALSSSISYQKRRCQAEEMAFISEIFDHAAQAHKHLSSVCANISALAKITDRVTLHTVINGAVHPLVQINIPEGFLNPVEDRWPKTTEEERQEKVREDDFAHIKHTVLGTQTEEWPPPVYWQQWFG